MLDQACFYYNFNCKINDSEPLAALTRIEHRLVKLQRDGAGAGACRTVAESGLQAFFMCHGLRNHVSAQRCCKNTL